MEHSYCMPLPKQVAEQEVTQEVLAHDHGYTNREQIVEKPPKPARQRKKHSEKTEHREFNDIYQRKEQIKPFNLQPVVHNLKFKERDVIAEMGNLYEFLTKGIDQEDINYLRTSYEAMLADDNIGYWLNDTHWVDHCWTDLYSSPPKKRKKDDHRVHATGCARTEGYYKIAPHEKAKYKYHHAKGNVNASPNVPVQKMQGKLIIKDTQLKRNNLDSIFLFVLGLSREARSNQRRLLTAFGTDTDSDLLKFNQLKFRKKHLKFAKSAIHDWGLFAMEPIAADEMVIEYVGQMVRPSVADLRETKYEATGIGSSYLFRIDLETIIDATKCGNLARFINHSCNVSNVCLNFSANALIS